MSVVEVRISKIKTLAFAASFAAFTSIYTPVMLAGVVDEASFQRRQELNAGDRRCIVCSMEYEPYRALIWASVVFLNGFFGSAVAVGLLRAFGPPTLTIAADGRGRYTLPWRTRTFRVEKGSAIKVTRFGLVFTPALDHEDQVKPWNKIPIRTYLIDRSGAALMHDLRGLDPSWTVIGR